MSDSHSKNEQTKKAASSEQSPYGQGGQYGKAGQYHGDYPQGGYEGFDHPPQADSLPHYGGRQPSPQSPQDDNGDSASSEN